MPNMFELWHSEQSTQGSNETKKTFSSGKWISLFFVNIWTKLDPYVIVKTSSTNTPEKG